MAESKQDRALKAFEEHANLQRLPAYSQEELQVPSKTLLAKNTSSPFKMGPKPSSRLINTLSQPVPVPKAVHGVMPYEAFGYGRCSVSVYQIVPIS